MPNSPDLSPILTFLDALSQNNHKAWFDQHRSDYEAARGTFEQFIDGIVDVFRVPDQLHELTARNCIARIYRDIRFSRDKSPYKTNFAAVIAPGGWKSTAHGYYISIQPHGQSMVAGGLHDPSPEQLDQFRQAMVSDPTRFKRLIKAKTFVEAFGTIEGERLKTAPKGYDRNHPEIALLQLKQITVVHRFADQEVLASDFAQQVVTNCRAMKPFLKTLSDILA